MTQEKQEFENLIAQAINTQFSGWDFSVISDARWREEKTSWDYRSIVLEHLRQAGALLDMGTGGGEFLASVAPLPFETYATESYRPNIPIAKSRLESLGVSVIEADSCKLPFEGERFELVINRHEKYSPVEIFRVLRPSGRFITQQVGSRNNIRLNEMLGDMSFLRGEEWNVERAALLLCQAGFEIIVQQEEFPETVFADIGAIVFYLKVIPWQIADFSVKEYKHRLYEMHKEIRQNGELRMKAHRFLIEAVKP